MELLISQEFWLSLAVIAVGGGCIWAVYRFGKYQWDRELGCWVSQFGSIYHGKNSSSAERGQVVQEFTEVYRSFLRERNDYWDKYGQILVAVVIIVVLAVLLLTKTISPEAGIANTERPWRVCDSKILWPCNSESVTPGTFAGKLT